MKLSEYVQYDGVGLAELVKAKEVSPVELVELSYEQLEKVNDGLNAVTNVRREQAMLEARNREYESLEMKDVDCHGLFSGVPIFLKDSSQSLAGELMTSGSRLFAGSKALTTSFFTQKLLDAGCIVLGHSTAPEFGLKNITEPKLYGPTRNPWNLDFSPGGSSGGSAALVASGVVPIAGASDGGGSIRIPASFTGLVGLKPTRGRMPVGPGVGRQWHGAAIDFVLSRSVRDSAVMLDSLQTVQEMAAFQTPLLEGRAVDVMKRGFGRQLRIGFSVDSPVRTPVSPEAKEAVLRTVAWLEGQGHFVEEVDNGIDGVQLMRDYYLMNSGEISALMMKLERALGRRITVDDVEIETWLLHVAGRGVSAAEFSLSLASWDVAGEKMARFHEKYDLYVTPTNAFTAPRVGELTHSVEAEEELRERMSVARDWERQEIIYEMFLPSLTYTPFTQLANLTGQPAISLPLFLSDAGLPLGVQLMARKGGEHLLLQVAYQLEQSELWVGMQGNPYF